MVLPKVPRHPSADDGDLGSRLKATGETSVHGEFLHLLRDFSHKANWPKMSGNTLLYRASKLDCDACPLKPQRCPKEPSRKIPRDIHEHARDVARSLAGTEEFEKSRRERKKIEMRFAHLKRILKLGRLRLRGPRGAQDEFVLAAIAQNLRRLASLGARPPPAQALCTA